MQTKAFVLLTLDVGKAEEVAETLRHVPGITAVSLVTGPYDAVATVEGSDPNAVGKVILNHLHGTPGVRGTLTMMVVG